MTQKACDSTQNATEQAQTSAPLSTSSIGRHSELLAMAALIADGWVVHEATTPEAYDLIAIKDGAYVRAQVKTIKQRTVSGSTYYVVRGLKNSGKVYTLADCDVFIGVIGNDVYLVGNSELTEYWIKADEASEKWRLLPLNISEKGAI